MSENNLSELQKRLLSMFMWYHDFCVENKLSYYAIYGTMLGAIRHKGFIPWDDDIDVGMPRKDYEKFIELVKNNNSIYKLETNRENKPDFNYGHMKLYDTRTTLIEKARKNIKRGIYIDIFPLDGAGNTRKEADKLYNRVFSRYKIVLARNCDYRKGRLWYKNFAIFLARLIPNWLLNDKKILKDIDILSKKFSFDDSFYVGDLLGDYGNKAIMEKKYMGVAKLYDFENFQIYGVEDYDFYLNRIYGDYNKFPPVENRVTRHEYVLLDLNESYVSR